MSDVYYKVTVTKGELSSTVYWWEKTYADLMESVDILYKCAKMDALAKAPPENALIKPTRPSEAWL